MASGLNFLDRCGLRKTETEGEGKGQGREHAIFVARGREVGKNRRGAARRARSGLTKRRSRPMIHLNELVLQSPAS